VNEDAELRARERESVCVLCKERAHQKRKSAWLYILPLLSLQFEERESDWNEMECSMRQSLLPLLLLLFKHKLNRYLLYVYLSVYMYVYINIQYIWMLFCYSNSKRQQQNAGWFVFCILYFGLLNLDSWLFETLSFTLCSFSLCLCLSSTLSWTALAPCCCCCCGCWLLSLSILPIHLCNFH